MRRKKTRDRGNNWELPVVSQEKVNQSMNCRSSNSRAEEESMGGIPIYFTLVIYFILVTSLTLILPPIEDSLSKSVSTPDPSSSVLVKIHCA